METVFLRNWESRTVITKVITVWWLSSGLHYSVLICQVSVQQVASSLLVCLLAVIAKRLRAKWATYYRERSCTNTEGNFQLFIMKLITAVARDRVFKKVCDNKHSLDYTCSGLSSQHCSPELNSLGNVHPFSARSLWLIIVGL